MSENDGNGSGIFSQKIDSLSEKYFDLDKKTALTEAKVFGLEDKMDESIEKIEYLSNSINKVELLIEKQSISLPRIEESISEAVRKIQSIERNNAILATKQKILWAVAASILTGLGAFVLKLLLGG